MPNSEVGTRAKQLVARLLDAITDADGTPALPGRARSAVAAIGHLPFLGGAVEPRTPLPRRGGDAPVRS